MTACHDAGIWPWNAADRDPAGDFGMCFFRGAFQLGLGLITSARQHSFWIACNAHASVLTLLTIPCLSIARASLVV
jgi:hypothetical protein